MRKISCLFLVLLLTTIFCSCEDSKPDEYDAVDMSYEHISELNDFKCYASYLDKNTTIEGETAKELYKEVTESTVGLEHSLASSQSDYIYLVFYNSTDVYPSSDKITEFYGCYFIYSDRLLQFAGSPYHSATFSYQPEKSIFTSVLEKTFP